MSSLLERIRSKTNITREDLIDDELYYEDEIIIKDCPLCENKLENDESYFNYIVKYPHPNIHERCTIYMNVKLGMCYDCLKLGIHNYYLNFKSFPKLRNDGLRFHNAMEHFSKKRNGEKWISSLYCS
jgi:hypothetical protein